MRIGTSTLAYSAYDHSLEKQQKALVRMATAQRINSAADDAAGLAIAEGMNGQISGLNQAAGNAQDTVSLLNTAAGGMSNSADLVQQMRQLNIQAANGTYTDEDRSAIQTEMNQLNAQLNTNAANTEFNTIKTNDGSLNAFTVQIGANSGQNMSFSIGSTSSNALGVSSDVSTQAAAENNLASLDNGLNSLSASQAQIGALSTTLSYSADNATQSAVHVQSAESRLRDADIGQQSGLFSQSQVGMYAAIMALSKSMHAQQGTLSLLV